MRCVEAQRRLRYAGLWPPRTRIKDHRPKMDVQSRQASGTDLTNTPVRLIHVPKLKVLGPRQLSPCQLTPPSSTQPRQRSLVNSAPSTQPPSTQPPSPQPPSTVDVPYSIFQVLCSGTAGSGFVRSRICLWLLVSFFSCSLTSFNTRSNMSGP